MENNDIEEQEAIYSYKNLSTLTYLGIDTWIDELTIV